MEEFSNLLKNISVTGDKGKPKVVFWQGKKAPTLEEAQAIVGGYIDIVPHEYHNIKDTDLIVNDDEGKVLNYRENELAKSFCEIPLMGNVLILKGEQRLK